MSSTDLESNRERSAKSRSSSPIRKYLSPSRTPLSSTDDNIQPSENKEKAPTKQKTFYDFYYSKKKTTAPLPTTSTHPVLYSASDKSSSVATPPPFKRSHSATSHLDTVNEKWLTTSLPPNKKTCNNKHYDRCTPIIADMASAQFNINHNNESDSLSEQIAKAVGIDTTKRILSYTPPAPIPKNNMTKNAPKDVLSTHTANHVKRHILLTPEKILDAPYIADDYYLNVLDWSKTNVVAVALDKAVYLWNANNGTIQALNYNDEDTVASVSWSGDGSYLCVGTTTGDTQIWDVQANTKLRSMRGQKGRIGVVAWDKHMVSSGAGDGSIFNHDVRIKSHVVRKLLNHEDEVCGLKWRWDGQLLASGGNDNAVNIWDARTSTPKHTRRKHLGAVKALAWCPWTHNMLATGGGRDDKKIHFWDTTSGSCLKSLSPGSQVTSLHWSQHYKEIVSTHGLPHNQITVWSYTSLKKIIDIPAHDSRILHSALSPDGQVLATAAADENLKFWRIFEADGKARLGSDSRRSTEKKELVKRSNTALR
ncbi:WD40-repeat-containing domain protein [Gilbertella persicaria]|uniref:WD40-repeat-containing domain protein n=1 Tax=Gilbertella persicaria TaxID=101096 RepID=UPI00221FD932|nr:WD40-repeat-containing domain protein [Gilbertella persicaria]KAI8076569.1 WD40-repeat-containing domain protein [Gilbertella persicaria]